jgi:hypothetical protein
MVKQKSITKATPRIRNKSSHITNPKYIGGVLPLHYGDGGGDVGEGRDPSGGHSSGVSPSNIRWYCLCYGVSVFLRCSPPEMHGGPLYMRI